MGHNWRPWKQRNNTETVPLSSTLIRTFLSTLETSSALQFVDFGEESVSSAISSELLKIGHSVQPSAFAVVTHTLWRFIQTALECIHFNNIARVAQRSCTLNSLQIFQSSPRFFNKVLGESVWLICFYCQNGSSTRKISVWKYVQNLAAQAN